MSEEIGAIVQAIEGLNPESNPFKDYVFPVITAFLSSLLGAFVAYFTIRHQDNVLSVKEKIGAMNDCSLSVENAMTSLVAIKNNYKDGLSNNPIQRALFIKSLVNDISRIEVNISTLSFIVPSKNDVSGQGEKWRSLPRIRSLVGNYNSLIDLWDKRKELERPIKERLVKAYGSNGYAEMNVSQILSGVDSSDFVMLIDLTERAVKYTDELLIESGDFLDKFPKIGEKLISRNNRKKYGPLLAFTSKENKKLQEVFIKTVEVDYLIVADLFGISEEDARKQYESGYE